MGCLGVVDNPKPVVSWRLVQELSACGLSVIIVYKEQGLRPKAEGVGSGFGFRVWGSGFRVWALGLI